MPYTQSELGEAYKTLFKIHNFDKKYKDGRYEIENKSESEIEKAVIIDLLVREIVFKKARITKTLKMYQEIGDIQKRLRFKKDSKIDETEKELSGLIKELTYLLRR